MTESILVLTHKDENGDLLTKASLEAVAAGLEISARLEAPLTIGIVAADATKGAGALAATGARLLSVEGEAFAQARYASDAAACEAICRGRGSGDRSRACQFTVCARCRWGCASPGRLYRYAHHIDWHARDKTAQHKWKRRGGFIASALKLRSAVKRGPGSCYSTGAYTKHSPARRGKLPLKRYLLRCTRCARR